MSKEKCPESIELTRAVSEGLTPALRAHLEVCPSCADEWQEINELLDIGKELPYEEPSRERLDQVRLGIYAGALSPDSSTRKSRRGLQPMPLMAVAFVALFVFSLAVYGLMPFWKNSNTKQTAHTLVVPQGVATYSLEADLPNQIIRLVDGTIRVSVDPLDPGQSVRVVVGKSHVIVHGTEFEVAAQSNRLIDVRVLHGLVEVQRYGQLPTMLATGNKLSDDPTFVALQEQPEEKPQEVTQVAVNTVEKPKSVIPAATPVVHAVVPAKPQKAEPEKAVPTPAAPKSLLEIAFEEGWRELKAGRYTAAAEAFGRAKSQNPSDPMTEDAAYWLAVSLKYSGRTGAAKSALESFLGSYPSSPRRGEASVMLGWIHFNLGSMDLAQSLFTASQNDRVARVRTSAEKGLVAIAQHQKANSDVFK